MLSSKNLRRRVPGHAATPAHLLEVDAIVEALTEIGVKNRNRMTDWIAAARAVAATSPRVMPTMSTGRRAFPRKRWTR